MEPVSILQTGTPPSSAPSARRPILLAEARDDVSLHLVREGLRGHDEDDAARVRRLEQLLDGVEGDEGLARGGRGGRAATERPASIVVDEPLLPVVQRELRARGGRGQKRRGGREEDSSSSASAAGPARGRRGPSCRGAREPGPVVLHLEARERGPGGGGGAAAAAMASAAGLRAPSHGATRCAEEGMGVAP